MKQDIVLRLRQIYCTKGAEFTRPELQAAWEEIERLREELAYYAAITTGAEHKRIADLTAHKGGARNEA